MAPLTRHDMVSGLRTRLIDVECQHCIRRGLFIAKTLKARADDTQTLEEAGVQCSCLILGTVLMPGDCLAPELREPALDLAEHSGAPKQAAVYSNGRTGNVV